MVAAQGATNGWELLPFFLFLCFMFFVCLAFVGGALWWIHRLSTPEARAAQRSKAEAWLESHAAMLAPWEPTSIGDISDQFSFRGIEVGTRRLYGHIRSVSRFQKLIAFYSIGGLGHVQLLARTTAHRWHMDYQHNTVVITLDGQPFGTWRRSDGVLLDANGQPIGEATRVGTGWFSPRNDQWSRMTLRGTPVGQILVQEGTQNTGLLALLKRRTRSTVRSVVIPAAPTLPQESERWLLAIAIFERSYRTVSNESLRIQNQMQTT
jgi:hypothetical protein